MCCGVEHWLKSQIVWLNRLLNTVLCTLNCRLVQIWSDSAPSYWFHLELLAAFCLQSSAGKFKKGSLRRRLGPPFWLDFILFYFLKTLPSNSEAGTRADASNVNRRDSFEFIGNRLRVHVKQQHAQLFCVRLPILGGGGGSGRGLGGQAEVKSETGCCIRADVARQKNTNKRWADKEAMCVFCEIFPTSETTEPRHHKRRNTVIPPKKKKKKKKTLLCLIYK